MACQRLHETAAFSPGPNFSDGIVRAHQAVLVLAPDLALPAQWLDPWFLTVYMCLFAVPPCVLPLPPTHPAASSYYGQEGVSILLRKKALVPVLVPLPPLTVTSPCCGVSFSLVVQSGSFAFADGGRYGATLAGYSRFFLPTPLRVSCCLLTGALSAWSRAFVSQWVAL
jgi:hypothetical protein